MFDQLGTCEAPPGAEQVRAWVTELAQASASAAAPDPLDLIAVLEELKCAAEGLQGDLAVDVEASRRRDEAERGVPESRRGRGVAAELALARRVSPHRGHQLLGLAKVLHAELPHTHVALRRETQRVAGDHHGPRDGLPLA
jgi:hypothetical protein